MVNRTDESPGVVTHVDESASEGVQTHLDVVGHFIGTHFEGKGDHEGGGGDGFSGESLPSNFVHSNSGTSASLADVGAAKHVITHFFVFSLT